jgi:hypothetical protein
LVGDGDIGKKLARFKNELPNIFEKAISRILAF